MRLISYFEDNFDIGIKTVCLLLLEIRLCEKRQFINPGIIRSGRKEIAYAAVFISCATIHYRPGFGSFIHFFELNLHTGCRLTFTNIENMAGKLAGSFLRGR